jgi:hypothetical protein
MMAMNSQGLLPWRLSHNNKSSALVVHYIDVKERTVKQNQERDPSKVYRDH